MFAWGCGVLVLQILELLFQSTRPDTSTSNRIISLFVNSAIVGWIALTLFH